MNSEIFKKFYKYGEGFIQPEASLIWEEMTKAVGQPCLYEFPFQQDINDLWEIVGYDFRSDPDGLEEFLAAVRIYVYLLTGIVSLNERFNDEICAGILTKEQNVVKVLV